MTEAESNDIAVFAKSGPLVGSLPVPGDKSITHRAILFGLLARGTTSVQGWLDGADCRSSIAVAQKLGAKIEVTPHRLQIDGTGGHLREPDDVLDCGNSGTTVRIFAGAVAARVRFAVFTGDDSLRRRPMNRIIEPLSAMGAQFTARSERHLPLVIHGGDLNGIRFALNVPSAQVKSSILVAGALASNGNTTVIEHTPTRDHTENMLPAFGVAVTREQSPDGVYLTVNGQQQFQGTHVVVPGDPSSAAFLLAAAAIIPESRVTVERVLLNPTRIGFLRVLGRMGARVFIENTRLESGEQIGDITVTAGPLVGTVVSPVEVPSLVDEIPVLAVVAAFAKGETRFDGAGELRIKETDRIRAICTGMRDIGVRTSEVSDGFTVYGEEGESIHGGVVESEHDHRIAMSFAIAGLACKSEIHIKNWSCVHVSFPSFEACVKHLQTSLK